MDLAELAEASLVLAPFLAGLLVVSTHVPLGQHVLQRGIIFIDITIAQVAALGVIVADVLGLHGEEGWITQLAATAAALIAALLLTFTERRFPRLQEAFIGSLYVLAASAAVLLLTGHPHGAEHMHQLLAGQILWVSLPDLLPVAALYAGVLALWFGPGNRRSWVFYLLFAITVTASVQLIGIYLVFATLILPALATQGWSGRRALGMAYGLGIAAYGTGLWASVRYDVPAGPTIVCALAGLALLPPLLLWLRALPPRGPSA